MQFLVLGELEVRTDKEIRPIMLSGRRPRSVLATLLLNANRVVPVGAMIDAVWPGGPPTTAVNTLQVHLRSVRNALQPGRSARHAGDRVVTEPAGYRLRVRP